MPTVSTFIEDAMKQRRQRYQEHQRRVRQRQRDAFNNRLTLSRVLNAIKSLFKCSCTCLDQFDEDLFPYPEEKLSQYLKRTKR